MNDPAPTPHGVWIPTAFYHVLLDCYYGVGPPHPKARTYTPPEPPPAGDPDDEKPTRGGDQMKFDGITSTRRRWIPKGVNARATIPGNDQQRTQPGTLSQPSNPGSSGSDGGGPPPT